MLRFEIPLPQSTVTKLSFSGKGLLRSLVLEMREQGMSYREIGRALGLHWTRVHQIVQPKPYVLNPICWKQKLSTRKVTERRRHT